MHKLVETGTAYRWGFPFKLFVDYKGKNIVLKTLQQAKDLEILLDNEEVEVEILNQRQRREK